MSHGQHSAAVKFSMTLEAKLGMLLEAKVCTHFHSLALALISCSSQERHTLIPASQRLLFCALFRECRLLTRSLKGCVISLRHGAQY